MSEPRLSLESEKLVRAYLGKIVLPTGALLVVVSFLLGFLIQHGAQNQAAKEAFQAATSELFKAIHDIEKAKNEADRLAVELQKIKADADDIAERLISVDVLAKAESNVSSIADAIARRPDFLNKIGDLPKKVAELRSRLDRNFDFIGDRIEFKQVIVLQKGIKLADDGGLKIYDDNSPSYFVIAPQGATVLSSFTRDNVASAVKIPILAQ